MGATPPGPPPRAAQPDVSTSGIAAAYDALAGAFHLVHRDWRTAVDEQGHALDRMIGQLLGAAGHRRILDCSCGIGTQAIGLALRGHHVTATDLSPGAVERARAEASSFGVSLDVRVADMRHLTAAVQGPFDVVLSCDNSIAHLDPDELVTAFGEMRVLAAPGGVVLVGLRDYDAVAADRPDVSSLNVSGAHGSRSITLQLWDWWPDEGGYDATLLFLEQSADGWRTSSQTLHLHAHRRHVVEAALAHAGLGEARWHDPASSGYYQPLVAATRS